jgi:hypothetical protein
MWAGIRGYRTEPKFPAVLADDELRAIAVPALLAGTIQVMVGASLFTRSG